MPHPSGLEHSDRRLRILIAAYFEKPSTEGPSEVDIAAFGRKFFGFCKEELKLSNKFKTRDLDDLLSPGHKLYDKTIERLVKFLQKRWEFFDDSILLHDIKDFQDNFYRALARHTTKLTIQLGTPLRVFDELDRAFLIGVYELYRHSFANEGKINVDTMVIRPDPTNPQTLRMEVIVKPHRRDRQLEHFEGLFCQYGQSLLGLPVYIDKNEEEQKSNARVRRYEFSAKSLKRTPGNLVKIGIVSGNSVQLEFPVAAKCLISKVSNDPDRVHAYSKNSNRYDAHRLHPPYVTAISNDIRSAGSDGDIDHLLVAWSSRPPKARSRNTFPELPDELSDPANTDWPNR